MTTRLILRVAANVASFALGALRPPRAAFPVGFWPVDEPPEGRPKSHGDFQCAFSALAALTEYKSPELVAAARGLLEDERFGLEMVNALAASAEQLFPGLGDVLTELFDVIAEHADEIAGWFTNPN